MLVIQGFSTQNGGNFGLKPLGARVWSVVDGNIEGVSRIIAGFIMTQPHGSVTISVRAD